MREEIHKEYTQPFCEIVDVGLKFSFLQVLQAGGLNLAMHNISLDFSETSDRHYDDIEIPTSSTLKQRIGKET